MILLDIFKKFSMEDHNLLIAGHQFR